MKHSKLIGKVKIVDTTVSVSIDSISGIMEIKKYEGLPYASVKHLDNLYHTKEEQEMYDELMNEPIQECKLRCI